MGRKPNMKFLKDDRSGNKRRARLIVSLAGVFALFLVVIYFFFGGNTIEDEDLVSLPSFSEIENIEERKVAFFEFLLPFIEKSNKQTLGLRYEVEKLEKAFGRINGLSEKENLRVRELQAIYKFEVNEPIEVQSFSDLLSRIDVIPASLALAQAALESGWGTSRFAREGNNLYGLWCYEPGCGIVPKKRPAGKTYEVQSFDSPKGCFDRYVLNLNTNPHYSRMRAIRRAMRSKDIELAGGDLIEGMERYSEEGSLYIEKVQRVISTNNLERFDS